MTQEQAMTPPNELVRQWRDEALNSFPDDENPCPCDIDDARDAHIATQAARWGADMELEACCEWLGEQGFLDHDRLCSARRPKPSSLKEQALEAQQRIWNGGATNADWQLIRRALEALPDDAQPTS